MRHFHPDPERRCAPDHPGHADRHNAPGTGPGTGAFPVPRAAGPAPGYARIAGPEAARVVRDRPAGNGADADSHDPFDPDLPLDALHAASLSADLPAASCPDDSWGVDSPVLRARLAEVLTRWTVATAVCFCPGPDSAPAGAGPARPGCRPGPGGAPGPCHPLPGVDDGDDRIAAGTGTDGCGMAAAVVGTGVDHGAVTGDPGCGRSEDAGTPDRGAAVGGCACLRFEARTSGSLPCDSHSGDSSPPGRHSGCPASDAIARLRSLIARHLPRTTCLDAGRDGAGTGGRSRVREPGAGSADTAEPGAGVAGTIPAGTGRTRGPGGGPGTEPPDGSRPEPGARTLSGAGCGRETGCRICLDRAEQAERGWRSFVRTHWPLCADVGASQAEPSAPARGSRGVAGGGDRC